MPIARYPVVVLDCADPKVLAEFYAGLLEWELFEQDGDSWFLRAPHGDALGFRRVDSYTPPQWPGQDVPQQMHLDLDVDDLDEAEAAALALGATKHEHQTGESFRVFLDPAGHPFCLCSG